MTSRVFLAFSFSILCVGPVLAAPLPLTPLQPLALALAPAEKATFWGRPYPYGYAYKPTSSCHIRRHVHGPSGWYWKQVNTCGEVVTKD